MEITTIAGMILSLVGLLGGMYFKHVSWGVLGAPAAIFMILIGTVGAVLNAFPKRDIMKAPKLFGLIFFDKANYDNIATIRTMVGLSQLVRKEGILILESKLEELPSEFLKRGISLLLTGQSHEVVEQTLSEELDAIEERHQSGALIFTQAGTYAPTLGVLGAVVGLVAALGNMGDTDALGHAISSAFIATIYGIFTGYVLWLPFANKLKRKSKAEILSNIIVLEGLVAMAKGESPNLVEEKMLSYLTKKEKAQYFAANAADKADKGGEK